MIELLYSAIFAWMLISTIWAFTQVQAFVRTTPSIADQQSLNRFKAIARLNMWLAVTTIVLFIPSVILVFMITLHRGIIGLFVVLAVNAVLIGLSLFMRRLEVKARSLPCANPELEAEFHRVCASWVKKLLPDF